MLVGACCCVEDESLSRETIAIKSIVYGAGEGDRMPISVWKKELVATRRILSRKNLEDMEGVSDEAVSDLMVEHLRLRRRTLASVQASEGPRVAAAAAEGYTLSRYELGGSPTSGAWTAQSSGLETPRRLAGAQDLSAHPGGASPRLDVGAGARAASSSASPSLDPEKRGELRRHELAAKLVEHGRFEEAEPVYRQELRECEAARGLAHPSTVAALRGLADLLWLTGRPHEAEPLCSSALEQMRATLGQQHASTIACVNQLGHICEAAENLREAETCFCQVSLWTDEKFGASHHCTLKAMMHLACVREALGKLSQAESICKFVLKAFVRTLGEAHPDTLQAAVNLASLQEAQGFFAEAEKQYRQVLAALEASQGSKLQIASTEHNVAYALHAQGKRTEAEPHFRRAAQLLEAELGAEHPDTLGSFYSLATLLKELGQLDEAEKLFRRELVGCTALYGRAHDHTLSSARNLGQLLKQRGRHKEADAILRYDGSVADVPKCATRGDGAPVIMV